MATPNRNDQAPGELKREVARSRQQLSREVERFRDELDFPKKIRRSFERRPALWIAGVTVAGAALVLLLAHKRKTGPAPRAAPAPKSSLLQAGFMLGALRIVANLIKPHLETFLEQKIRGYSAGSRREK
jgi:hypothetical protein